METFICSIRTHVLMTIIEGLFHSPQTLNGHVEKGTGSLIRLPRVTTVKWLQIGAALTFLSHTPSLDIGTCGLEQWERESRHQGMGRVGPVEVHGIPLI